jgi:hypothetical protein
MSEIEEVTLNANLVTAVLEVIDVFSKKGVFKLTEYKDVATITERLTEVKEGYEKNNSSVDPLSINELAFIIQLFREGSQRVPTSVDSFGQIFAVYQHYNKVLEQEVEKEKEKEKNKNVPSVEELDS